MPNLVPPKSGEFDQFETGTYSFQTSLFEVIGSNGTIAASEVSYFFTGTADYFNQLLTFGISEVQELVIETQPRPILSLPIFRTGFASPFDPSSVYLYNLREEYTVSSTNGTRPAPVIFHNQGVFTLDRSTSFEDPGLKRSGLLYPRRKVTYVNRVSSVATTTFGSFNIGGFRASSQKRFFTDQVYPTNLDSGQITTQRVFTQPLAKRYSRLFSTGRYSVVGIDQPFDTDSSVPDPNFSSVSLLLRMDGTNGSTTFTDSSSNAFAVTAFGNAQVTTTDPRFGTGALALDGSGDYLTVAADADFQFGTGNFTVECWVYVNSSGNSNNGLFTFGGTSSGLAVAVYQGQWYLTTAGGGGTAMGSFTTGIWQHLAVARSGSSLRMFINGTQTGSTLTNSTNLSDNALKVGYYYSSSFSINARIDEFRVTKGIARYTSNFTPPTEPFPTSGPLPPQP
jgi:hypothetical protein